MNKGKEMTKIREWFRSHTKGELVLFFLVCVQIVYLLIFNILRTKYIVNFDSSEYMIQVIQIWNQKTLLIEDYYYSTMLTWDMPTLIAVLFYGIFHDVFLAYGLANNVLIIIFVLLLNKLCNDLEFSKNAKYLVFLAIFTVYQFGNVDYIEELFVNGALYGFRILFMLILMDVLICLHKDICLKRNIGWYIICIIGCFFCGISSGIFELGCCILPIVLFELWHVLSQEDPIKIRHFIQIKTIVPMVAAIACVFGVLVNYLLGFEGSAAAEKTTIAATDMADNLLGMMVGFFQLFGWTDSNIAITSIAGIMSIAAFFAASVVIVVFAFGVRIAIKNVKHENVVPVQKNFSQMVFFIFLVNFLLFSLANLTYGSSTFEYRYWLMIVIPVFIEIGIVYEWTQNNMPYNYRVVLVSLYVLLLTMICGYKDIGLWRVEKDSDYYEQMMDTAEELDLDIIFIYADFFSSREFSAFAKDSMEVFSVANVALADNGKDWILHKFRMPRWGTYVKYDGDCLELGDNIRHGIFIREHYGICPDYDLIVAQAKDVISFGGTDYKLLIMDKNYMDFIYGLPEIGSNHSRDYFNGDYVIKQLQINEDGYYQSSGSEGTILEGTFYANESGVYSAVLQYEVIKMNSDTPAQFMISVTDENGNVTQYKENLDTDLTEISLENLVLRAGDKCVITVVEELETVLTLKQIDYYLDEKTNDEK